MTLQHSPHYGTAINKHTQLQLSFRPTPPPQIVTTTQPSPVVLHRPLDKLAVASRLAKRYVADLILQGDSCLDPTMSVGGGNGGTHQPVVTHSPPIVAHSPLVTHSPPVTHSSPAAHPVTDGECAHHTQTLASLQQQVK